MCIYSVGNAINLISYMCYGKSFYHWSWIENKCLNKIWKKIEMRIEIYYAVWILLRNAYDCSGQHLIFLSHHPSKRYKNFPTIFQIAWFGGKLDKKLILDFHQRSARSHCLPCSWMVSLRLIQNYNCYRNVK